MPSSRTWRATIAAGLAKLEDLGFIARIKRRVRLSWHQGGERSAQVTSCYRLAPLPASDAEPEGAPHSEFSGRTVNQGMEILYQERLASDDGEAVQKALQEIAAARAVQLQRAWAARRE